MGFKSSAREDATFHSTFILHTQIGGKLENILNKLPKKRTVHALHQTTVHTLDHWRRLQHTFRCFRTKTRHAARRMKSFRIGHVTCRMLSIKKRLLSPLFCTKYLISCRDVRCYNDIKRSGKYSSDFVQNFAKNNNEYCCVVQMHGSEYKQHFRWFWSDAVIFWLFKVFSLSLQHIRQGKHPQLNDQKYNFREYWCYIICIKRCFLGTNQTTVTLCACGLFVSKVTKITWYDVDVCFFAVIFRCFFSVWWLYLQINHSLVAEIICTIYSFIHASTQHFK